MNKYYQSCGMPLKNDPQVCGTNADGMKNLEYCSDCYVDGNFTEPDFTAKQMQDFCVEKLIEMKVPSFMAWLLTRKIPRLKRWKN